VAVAVHINPHQMTKKDYERVISELQASGADEPEGRRFHAAYGDDDNLSLFEVWDSKEQFDAHSDDLFATLQGAGVDAGSIEVHQLQSAPPD
jgi:quinol monooxygenase YgiN